MKGIADRETSATERISAPISVKPPINAHDILERERLIRTRVHADHIRRNPKLLDDARAHVGRGSETGRCSSGNVLWQKLLRLDVEQVIAAMLADNPDGQLLRSDSPFHILVEHTNEAERRQSWRQAKAELSAPMA